MKLLGNFEDEINEFLAIIKEQDQSEYWAGYKDALILAKSILHQIGAERRFKNDDKPTG